MLFINKPERDRAVTEDDLYAMANFYPDDTGLPMSSEPTA